MSQIANLVLPDISLDLDLVLSDLRQLIADLGRDGGLMDPSLYETARVLCLAPPPEGPQPALDWLAEQQLDDGGWGDPSVPHSRDLPTPAAVLALYAHTVQGTIGTAVQRGLDFLSGQAAHWAGSLGADIPVGIELLLPPLLDEAEQYGMAINRAP